MGDSRRFAKPRQRQRLIITQIKLESKEELIPPRNSDDDEDGLDTKPILFSCHICSSTFVTSLSLTRHMIYHENDPSFICSFCEAQFAQSGDLAHHITKEHSDDKVNQKGSEKSSQNADTDEAGANNGNGCSTDLIKKEADEGEVNTEETYGNAEFPKLYNDDDDDEIMDDDDDDGFRNDFGNGGGVSGNNNAQLNCDNGSADEADEDDAGLEYNDFGEAEEAHLMNFYGNGEDDEVLEDALEDGTQIRTSGSQEITTKINPSLNRTHIERKHICQECGAGFVNIINFQRHMTVHFENRPHKCHLCDKGFVRKEHLIKHLSSVHSGLKFTCEFCGKDISRKDHLIRHIRNVHPTEYLGIPTELMDTQNLESLSVTNLRAAGFVISDKALLSMQPKPKKPYLTCDMCNETFPQLNDLHAHQSDVHRDVRKYKCPDCPKAFKRKEHLTKHEVLHTGEKKFHCNICGKLFPRKDALQDHIRRIHGSGHVTCVEYPCNFCEKVFLQRPNLVRHLRNIHGLVINIPQHIVPQQTTFKIEAPPLSTSGSGRIVRPGPSLQSQSHPQKLIIPSNSTSSLLQAQQHLNKISRGNSSITISAIPASSSLKAHSFITPSSTKGDLRVSGIHLNPIPYYSHQQNRNRVFLPSNNTPISFRNDYLSNQLQSFSCAHCNAVFSDEKMFRLHLNSHRAIMK